jgi:hypothetical protein
MPQALAMRVRVYVIIVAAYYSINLEHIVKLSVFVKMLSI